MAGRLSLLGAGIQKPISPAGGDWWLAGGIAAANCIAAYQAKGAASYAASKVNLANPGTYNLADGTGYPTWNATDGWVFDGVDDILRMTSKPVALSWSFLVKYSDGSFVTGNDNAAVFSGHYGYQIVYIKPSYTGKTVVEYGYTTAPQIDGERHSGVGVIANNKYYHDKVELLTTLDGGDSRHMCGWDLGGYVEQGKYYPCHIQAFSVYNIEISVAQVAALTDAVNAL